jgi:hypothetical protein
MDIKANHMNELRENAFWRHHGKLSFALVCALWVGFVGQIQKANAQVSTVVFQDDFESNTIDSSKFEEASPFFEGGVGDIHAEAGDGVMRFVGTTTQQWWSGGTLRIKETFDATPDTPVTASIDRVEIADVGTAERSALWILDESETNYVLFAQNAGENGWQYNRKIGQAGDNPTGGGSNIVAFDSLDGDLGLHRMSIVANGSTVKLLLDGEEGAEVPFPFSPVVFHFGAYARANNDAANVTWDNLTIETVVRTTTLFEDDFESDSIDAAKFEPAAPFFEGGVGDIHAEAGNGVMRFTGTTTQQWWSGGTLRIKETFAPTQDAPVTASIDRVEVTDVGTAARSALWILDESETNYVLFAQNAGENGWQFNRKIGQAGDNPTGGGSNIAAFDSLDGDLGLHRMSIVANGSTVKLLLDGEEGAEVPFPFSPVVFHFGAYARANNDQANVTWDNLEIVGVPQQSNIVFSDDFESNDINPAKYVAGSPFFEGGVGDIRGEPGDGVMRFVGTTTQQWWSGGTLQIVPTFAPSDSEKITISIDRVSVEDVGTATRSALWILDESQSNYVLFAQNAGENGWQFNRKIGQEGDTPTGGGANIAAFDSLDGDTGLHNMSMVANGQTVKLLLDGVEGAEVPFPFSPVVFHFGAYARANNDNANVVWDNLVIESEGGATFSPGGIGVREGGTSQPVSVRIPQGLNSQRAVSVTVVSADPGIATPEGGTGGKLTLTFPAGGDNSQTFRISGVSLGGTEFSLQGDIAGGNRLSVAVISDPGVVLEDDFAGSIDGSNWQISEEPFGNGSGSFTVEASGGQIQIEGIVDTANWAGASLKTVNSYLATEDLNLVVEVDRVSIDQFGTAGRTGVFLTNDDRSRFVFLSQELDDANNAAWRVNTNPGSPTGGGTIIAAFAPFEDFGEHQLKLVANGSTVEVFVDGVSGGEFAFEVSAGIHVELGAYAQNADDDVIGLFDNVKIENVIPCIDLSPSNVLLTLAERGEITVTVPRLLNDSADVSVTLTSNNPAVAVPAGASNGSLTLTFPAGSSNKQTVGVSAVGLGSASFTATNDAGACVDGSVSVEIVSVPETFLTDDFSGSSLDGSKWTVDETPFDPSGILKPAPESEIRFENGEVVIHVEVEQALWPGIAIFTVDSYSASSAEPLTFEIDRSNVDFVLEEGTGSESRTGLWVRDGNGNFILFNDYTTHDGRNYGWHYNKVTGAPDDDATGIGVNIPAFDGPPFDNGGDHRMKITLNGASAKLFLDDVFGVEIDFPFSSGLQFGIGAYADNVGGADPETGEIQGNQTIGNFDNAVIKGGSVPFVAAAEISSFSVQEGNLVIEWTGNQLLESSTVTGPFTPVAGATPPSSSIEIGDGNRFFIAQ